MAPEASPRTNGERFMCRSWLLHASTGRIMLQETQNICLASEDVSIVRRPFFGGCQNNRCTFSSQVSSLTTLETHRNSCNEILEEIHKAFGGTLT